MLINILFVLLWGLTSSGRIRVSLRWRIVWKVLGILNLLALAWSVFVLAVVFLA